MEDPLDETFGLWTDANDAFEANELEKAKQLYVKALDKGERLVQKDERIEIRECLAICLFKMNEFAEAERYDQKTLQLLEGWRKGFGPGHDLTVKIRQHLARDLSALHDQDSTKKAHLEEAVRLHRENIEHLRKSTVRDGLLESQSSLVFDLTKMGKSCEDKKTARAFFEEAASIGEEVLQMRKQGTQDSKDRLTIEARHNYASILYHLERHAQAKDLFLENQKILDGLSTREKKALGTLVRSTDRYLAASIEVTKDLNMGISRRATEPLTTVDPPEEPRKSKTRDSTPVKKDRATSNGIPEPGPDKEKKPISRPPLIVTPDSDKSRSKDKSIDKAPTKPEPYTNNRPRHNSADSRAAQPKSQKKAKTIKKSKSEEQLPKQKSSLAVEQPARPRSASNSRSNDRKTRQSPSSTPCSPSDDGSLFQASVTSESDKWLRKLRTHTHSLLQYDDEARIPDRKRVRVAILDSGIDKRRADIKKHRYRIQKYRNFNGDAEMCIDSTRHFHGTNCASLLLYVAPHVDVYIANIVRSADEKPVVSQVGAAMAWALDNGVDIISMSLGFETWQHQISKQIDRARQEHVLVFAAASNDGHFAPDYGVYPAWAPTVVCINSSKGSGARSDFNPRHTDDKVNFMFLGEDISIPGLKSGTEGAPTGLLSGTSYATPIAAGTAALVLDLVRIEVARRSLPYPKIERCLKTYEGMSAVFKEMSGGKPTHGNDYYHVQPWTLLGEKGPPLSIDGVNESKSWYTLSRICERLARFGDVRDQLVE